MTCPTCGHDRPQVSRWETFEQGGILGARFRLMLPEGVQRPEPRPIVGWDTADPRGYYAANWWQTRLREPASMRLVTTNPVVEDVRPQQHPQIEFDSGQGGLIRHHSEMASRAHAKGQRHAFFRHIWIWPEKCEPRTWSTLGRIFQWGYESEEDAAAARAEFERLQQPKVKMDWGRMYLVGHAGIQQVQL